MLVKDKLFIALDDLSREEILELADEFGAEVMFKVNDAFLKYGHNLMADFKKRNCKIFLDCKWNDTPNTVANYVKAIADMGQNLIYCFTIHCSGGFEMMKAVANIIHSNNNNNNNNNNNPKILGVTVLTSFTENSLHNDLLYDCKLKDLVVHLAKMAKKAGLDGVICSPEEITVVKEACGQDFITITPGIRPQWATEQSDQKRVMTPFEAMKLGTDHLVIGRPFIQAHKFNLTRREALNKLQNEIISGIASRQL